MNHYTVLVVGGAGYIGAHMVKELLAAGHHPVVLDNLSKGHRDLVPGGRFIQGEMADHELLERIFSEFPIDAVMHFAAYSLVGESVVDPLSYYRNNVAATAVLLEAMVRHRIERFIFSSTAAVYGEPTAIPILETHPCQPTNPYGRTKLTVERMLADVETAFGLRHVCLRYFNAAGADSSATIGERHDPETHLIPIVLQAAAGLRPEVHIFGEDYPTPDGTCLRDYVHVTDLCSAHLLALEALMHGAGSNVYNLGNSRGYSVREIVERATRITGRAIRARIAPRRKGDPAVLVADSDKIRGELGWRPVFERVDAIIESAWRWHRREADL